MKAMVISLMVLFLLPVSAIEFSISAPSEITQEKEFLVTLLSREKIIEDYDVKIFINRHTKEFSERFYDGKWNSPFKYAETFPENKEFKLIAHKKGIFPLCARLRPAEKSKDYYEACTNITIFSNNITYKTKTSIKSKKELEDFQSPKIKNFSNTEDKLVLGAKRHTKQSIFRTREFHIRRTMNYSFIIFLVIFSILVFIRKSR